MTHFFTNYLILENICSCDAVSSVSPTNPTLVLDLLAAQHVVTSNGSALSLNANAPDAILQVTRSAIYHLKKD